MQPMMKRGLSGVMRSRLASVQQLRQATTVRSQNRAVSQMTAATTQSMPPMSTLSPAKPWKNTLGTSATSFSQEHLTEFKDSCIPGAGLGWWAKANIPAGVRLRRVSIADGSLMRFADEAALRATGWDMDDAVHYGIGHKADRSAVYYLNPGTPCNHADPEREVSVAYHMTNPGEMELWTVRDIQAGEEILIDYAEDYVSCEWYEKLCIERNLTPLSKLGSMINSMFAKVPKPWENTARTTAASFSQEHSTEFRPSGIEGAGLGWWAKADVPAGVRLRRVTVADGSLHRFGSEAELDATGWDMREAVHYGIGHKTDRSAIYWLNPGTPCNHADPSRVASVEYRMDKAGEMELWTLRDVKAGEEILIDYTKDYVTCAWYDKLCIERFLTPLSAMGWSINAMCGGSKSNQSMIDQAIKSSAAMKYDQCSHEI